MDIVIKGKLVSGDLLVSAVLRSDMAPVPQLLEATIRITDKAPVAEGDIVSAGRDNANYRVVKVKDQPITSLVQGDYPYTAQSFIALLDSCADVSFQRQTAVIKTNTTLGGIYRACGSSVSVESDFPVSRFSSFVGSVPSYSIAQVLQEEGGVVFWTGERLRFIRLPDLFKQAPVKTLTTDSTLALESGYLERHEIPFFYSIDETGAFVFGDRSKTRVAQYLPRQDARTLGNLTRVLVMKRELKSVYSPALNAGQLLRVVDTDYAIVTAAHTYETGTDEGNGPNAYTKLWLGEMQ